MTAFIFDVNQRLTTSTSSVSSYVGGLPFDSSGAMVIANGTSAPLGYSNGIPFDGEAVAVDATNAVANYMNGLPFTANGRIAVSTSTPVDAFSNGLPFIGGKLCVTTASASVPNMQTVVASAVADLDATIASSYTSGQTFANLVTAPADGAAQTAYDFWLGTNNGSAANDPTFATDKFTLDGGDWFTIKANTTLVNNLHKTTGGSPHTFFIAGKFTARGVAMNGQAIYGDGGRDAAKHGTAVGNGYFGTANTYQRNSAGGSFSTSDTQGGAAFADDTYKVLAFTYDPSTRATKAYINSATPYTSTVAFYASTTDASDALQVGAAGAANSPLYNGTEIKAFGMCNAIISDAEFTAIRNEYIARHGAIY